MLGSGGNSKLTGNPQPRWCPKNKVYVNLSNLTERTILQHPSYSIVRPRYSCGACPAKFFKNSFLVKHVESHLFFTLPQ